MHALTIAFWLIFAAVAIFVAWSFFRMFVLETLQRRDRTPRRPPGGSAGPRNESTAVDSVGLAGVGAIASDSSSYAADFGGGDSSGDSSSGDSSGGDSGGGDASDGGGDYGGGGGSGGW